MSQGHIGRLPGLHRERHANYLRLHVVQTGRLRVEREQLGIPETIKPDIKGFLLGYNVVGAHYRLDRLSITLLQQLLQPGPELHAGIPLHQGITVRLAVVQLLRRQLQFNVCLDRSQGVRHVSVVFFSFQLGRQGLGTAKRQPGHLVQRSVNLIHTTQPLQ